MMAAKLVTVLTVLALLGPVSCQSAGNRAGNPAPAPQAAPTHPPIASQPPSYRPIAPRPSTHRPPSPRPPPPSPPSSRRPPPPARPPTTSQSQPPAAYHPIAPRPSSPPRLPPSSSTPPPSARPPTTSQPPSYRPIIAPRPSTYPPTSPSTPPPPLPPPASTPQQPAHPPTTSQPPSSSPPTTTPQPPTNPPPTSPSPSPPPPVPAAPPPSSDDDAGNELVIGYYKNKCGPYDVEAIVRKHVGAFDAGMKAGIIRMFFHDCFIRGCDASILLDPTSDNPQPEKLGIPNFPSMRGYEVIDAAKAELEAKCPGEVSCADIVAFAARDASYFLSGGGISFDVPAGRYDGTVSLASETLPNLPPPFAGLQQLQKMFADRGLDAFDMVTLSGAHSVGRSHCSSFSRDRLPPGTGSASDMNSTFAAELQANCTSANGADDNTVAQDYVTPDELDNQYYQNVLDKKVLFTSDAALTSQDMTGYLVRVYAIFPWLWQQKYAEAMVKMGGIEIKTAATGEIRKTCRVVNSKP